MSRWLWALLAGVVLVAIAAVFWIASNQTNVTAPGSPGTTSVAPAPALPAAQKAAPSPSPPAAQQAAAPPAPALPAPAPAPDAGQQATSLPTPTAPSPEKPAPPPVVAQAPSPRLL